MNRVSIVLIALLVMGISQTDVPAQVPQEQTPRSTKPRKPLTWAQFIEQGGSQQIQVDFDLPADFRNGFIYFNSEENRLSVIILKQSLRRYPPIQTGRIELNYAYMPLLESRGEMMILSWEVGPANPQHGNNASIHHPYPNRKVTCLSQVCLLASMLTEAERERILRSQHPIQP